MFSRQPFLHSNYLFLKPIRARERAGRRAKERAERRESSSRHKPCVTHIYMRLGIFLPCCTVSYSLLISYYTIDHSVFPLNLLSCSRSAHQVPCATLSSLGETARGTARCPRLNYHAAPRCETSRSRSRPLYHLYTAPLADHCSSKETSEPRIEITTVTDRIQWKNCLGQSLSFTFTFLSSVNLWAKEAPRRLAKV